MATGRKELVERYRRALAANLTQHDGEADLIDAVGLGRAALDQGCGLLDVLSMHRMLLLGLVEGLSRWANIGSILERSEDFLAQVVAPFEMTHRGWHEVVGQLRQLNETLEERVRERTSALRASERRFQDIAEVSGDWIWESNREHRLTSIFGESAARTAMNEMVVGKTRWELANAYPDIKVDWAGHMADLEAHREFRHFQYAMPTPDSQRMIVSVSGKPVFDERGDFVGYRGTASDVTAVIEARRQVEEAEALLRDAIESISGGVAIWDEDRLVMCNEIYRRLYPENTTSIVPGIRYEDLLRQGVAGHQYPDAEGREDDWIAERLHEHRFPEGSTEQQLSDGRWMLVTRRRMANGWIAALRIDITAVKLAQAALAETNRQLAQSQKMEAIGNLTGGMAHDFNNLLGIIIGNLDLLRDRQTDDSDAQELSGDALDAALRGAELTKRLLAFARRQPLQPQNTDVNELVTGTTNLLKRTLGEQIEITLELSADIWPVVVDPAQLESSLTNLATNARDAMAGGGHLIIATGNRHLDADYASQHAEVQPGDYALIEISDTGAGMSPEVASRIFEPFYTTKEHGTGTGLGLSMVFGFIKQSGGHINVYSELGIGTTFRLYLPRAAVAADTADVAMPEPPTGGRGETVLAVEDNTSLRRVVTRQLIELGYRVLEAEDAPAALMVLESEKVDLLFTDIVMPGGTSGYELARTARLRWPHLKIVLTSGFPDGKLTVGAQLTNTQLLSKPYRRDDMARTIRDVLDRAIESRPEHALPPEDES